MQRRYVTVDVFTDQPFGGNPLAVVLDAEGLDTGAMQAIAREFNYSETTFVLPPSDPANTAQIRIFTPYRELPFAGHPNVGTAYVLAHEGHDATRLLFEEAAGLVPVEILRDDEGTPFGAELTAPKLLERVGEMPVDAVAQCLSLRPGEITVQNHRPLVASVGLRFVLAEITSRSALSRAKLDPAAWASHMPFLGTDSIYFYTTEGGGFDLHSRMFWPGPGEDPATGSATVTLAALLADAGPEGEMALRIEQGRDMGRPSTLLTRAVKQGGIVRSAHVGGRCIPMMRGTLAV